MNDLGLYIHIPFCSQKCIYCDFAAYERLDAYVDTYVEALLLELEMYAQKFPKAKIATIYFGGGTPTYLEAEQIKRIFEKIKVCFDITECQEITIESNPDNISYTYLKKLREYGFNRISFGVQTLKDDLLKILRRTHSGKEALNAISEAREAGFDNINVDVIYGLPTQTMDDIKNTLEQLFAQNINHISIYGLQVEQATYLNALIKQGKYVLPNDTEREKMFDFILGECKTHGFEHYEISNFSKNKKYGLHNLKYWNGDNYIACGASAHGYINGIRYENTPYVVPYIQKIENYNLPVIHEEIIDSKRASEDYCFLRLRTKWGLDVNEYAKKFNQNFEENYKKELNSLIDKGLLEKNKNIFRLTNLGIKYGNYVFSHFIK